MMKVFYPLVGIMLLTLISCTPYATSTKDNPKCPTVVKGILHAPISVKNFDPEERPLMISKKNGVQRVEAGTVVSQDSNGIMFKRKKVGVAGGGTERFYKYSEIMCLLDSSNKVIYGSIAACNFPKWSIELRLKPAATRGKTKETVLLLNAEEEFSYCIEPGAYEIVKMKFILNGNIDANNGNANLLTNIEEGRVNYLGKLTLDSDEKSPNAWIIPCSILERNSDGAAFVMFGFTGLLVNKLVNGSTTQHTLLYTPGTLPAGAVYTPITLVK